MNETIEKIYLWENQTLHQVESILMSRNDPEDNTGSWYRFIEPGEIDITKPMKTILACKKNNTITWMRWL
jgi:hypothetical protein